MNGLLDTQHTPGAPVVFLDRGTTYGTAWFVNSGHAAASDNNSGTNPNAPLATLAGAISRATAGAGDDIYVAPGHSESLSAAAAVNLSKAGVTVYGLGRGSLRPTFDFAAVAATFAMNAANCAIFNLLFTCTADATIGVDVNAADCLIDGCEFRNGTGKEFVSMIDVNGGAENACDRTAIRNCVFRAPVAGTTQAIEIGEVCDGLDIRNNIAFGAYGNAPIHNPTGKVATWALIKDNVLVNTTAASHSIELVSACTGVIADNRCGSPLADATPADIDGGAAHILENYSHDAGGNDSGLLNPVADS